MNDYKGAKQRLIEHVRRMNEPFSVTPCQRRAQALAEKLNAVLCELGGQSTVLFDLEHLHDTPPREFGYDGLPVEDPGYHVSFNSTVSALRELANSAKRLADSYPEPRKKLAVPDAALGFLLLRLEHGFPKPTLYGAGQDLRELASICEAAGVHKAGETLRNALSGALRDYDPHMPPPWFYFVLTGRH